MLTAISFDDREELKGYTNYTNNESVKRMWNKVEELNNDEHFWTEEEFLLDQQILARDIEEEIREVATKEGYDKGLEQGLEQGKIESAKQMIIDGVPLTKIYQYTSLSMEIIKKLASDYNEKK